MCVVSSVHSYVTRHMMLRSSHILLATKGFGLQAPLCVWCADGLLNIKTFTCILHMQVDKAEQDKQSAIIKAQGEATSARLIGEAIQENPAFITLRKIEAARDIAGTISGAANKVFLSSDSLLLNLVSLFSLPSPDSSHRHLYG